MKTFVPILMTASDRQRLLAEFEGTDVIEHPPAPTPARPEPATARARRLVETALTEAGLLTPEPRSRR